MITSVENIANKSRFVGYATRIANKDEADAFIADITALHTGALSVAYAYALTYAKKMHDGAERRGIAGLPIYSAIVRRNLKGVAVVVVREFGGKMTDRRAIMGAYGKTARLALEENIPPA